MKNNTVLHSLGHAVLVLIYTSGVAWLLFNGKIIFGDGEPKNFWAPVFMLLLFVLSATIVGTLVLGKPILLYWNGAKSEALRFFTYTVGWLFIILLIVFLLRPWQ